MENTKNYEVTTNQWGATDIHFSEKPSKSVIELLKANGFRWFGKTESWSSFKVKAEDVEEMLNGSKITTDDVKKSIYELTAFEIITDDDVKKSIVNNYYGGNCHDWYKHYIVLRTKDNLYIALENNKPSIDSQMWYPDHLEAPSTDYEGFENYNLFYNYRNIYFEDENNSFRSDTLLATPRYAIDDNFRVLASQYDLDTKDWDYKSIDNNRKLTDDEISDLKAIDEFRKDAYIKRLKVYFKKYSHKIHASGYWADR